MEAVAGLPVPRHNEKRGKNNNPRTLSRGQALSFFITVLIIAILKKIF